MKIYNVYEVYDEDGEFVIRGIGKDLAAFFGDTSPNVIGIYARQGMLFQDQYIIKKVGQIAVENKEDKPEVIKSKLAKPPKSQEQKDNETLEYLILHLQRYGNTCLNEKPKRFIPLLKERGYNCSYRRVKGLKFEGGRAEPFYVLEVIDN